MTHALHADEKSSIILLLMTMTLLAVFPLDVVLPSFPALTDHFQISPPDIALSVSLFAVGLALSVMLVGPSVGHVGPQEAAAGRYSIAQLARLAAQSPATTPGFWGFVWSRRLAAGHFPCLRR